MVDDSPWLLVEGLLGVWPHFSRRIAIFVGEICSALRVFAYRKRFKASSPGYRAARFRFFSPIM